MQVGRFGIVCSIVLTCFLGVSLAADSQTYFPPDLVGQVDGLARRADALGWHIGDSPDPSMCYHYQGIARSTGPGTPYFFVSKSGNFPGPICLTWCGSIPCTEVGDGPGTIQIVRMGSRGTDGERLRSNRIVRNKQTGDSVPPAEDVVVKTITLDGTNGWPNYGHPGGMQMLDDVLAVAIEKPYSAEDADAHLNRILFIDVADPENPRPLSAVPILASENFSAGVVAITRQPNGIYLMIVTGQEGDRVKVYESYPNREDGTTDLRDPNLAFGHKTTWVPAENPVNPPCWSIPPSEEYPQGWSWGWPEGGTTDYAHQNLSFVREGGPDGPLYLIGTRNDNALPGIFGDDMIDLYEVHWDGQTFGLGCPTQKKVDAVAASDGALIFETKIAEFGAAAGTYVSPTGELIVYSTEHDNDGPGGTVKMGEFRLRDMVHSFSPTLDPTVVSGGPYSVPEGGAATLTAVASPPRTKAWVQLYADRNYSKDDRYLVVDYPDWTLDNIDDFNHLDEAENNPFADGFSDQMSSVRWFAPVGCTIRLNDDDFMDDSFPGEHVKTLVGNGELQVLRNLDDVLDDDGEEDMDDVITSMKFFPDCDTYYDPATLQVAWDMNGDATYEVAGASVPYSAAGFDGPTSTTLGVRVHQPSDDRNGFDTAAVTITNVPPVFTGNAVTDAAGRVFGTDIDFVLIGIPVKLSATFVDPGVPDTQSAHIDWGDGQVSHDADFDEFAQATGGVTGRVGDRHAYFTAGYFAAALNLFDDDGGLSTWGTTVHVLDARAAILDVVEDLDVLIANASGAGRKALLDARDSLVGSPDGSSKGGAVDKLDAGDREAAVVKLGDAIDELTKAELATGLNHDGLQATLALAAYSIAAEAQADAIAANPSPAPGEARQLATIQQDIDLGSELLATGDFAAAVDEFHDAVSRAVSLL
jgi:hypothetical protein